MTRQGAWEVRCGRRSRGRLLLPHAAAHTYRRFHSLGSWSWCHPAKTILSTRRCLASWRLPRTATKNPSTPSNKTQTHHRTDTYTPYRSPRVFGSPKAHHTIWPTRLCAAFNSPTEAFGAADVSRCVPGAMLAQAAAISPLLRSLRPLSRKKHDRAPAQQGWGTDKQPRVQISHTRWRDQQGCAQGQAAAAATIYCECIRGPTAPAQEPTRWVRLFHGAARNNLPTGPSRTFDTITVVVHLKRTRSADAGWGYCWAV
jgi:hypothetical protein